MKNEQAIVIGAGIAGIAAAIRLSVKGCKVRVFEQNAYPGGKIAEVKNGNYRWDAGPSLFTLPEQVDELFRLAGENPRDHFNYERLSTVCNYFWEDDTFLAAPADEKQFASRVAQTFGLTEKSVINYLKKSRFIYETTAPVFLDQSLHKVGNYLNFKTLKGICRMPRLGIFSVLNSQNEKQLRHPALVQLFNRYATYNGSDPYRAPAVLQSIPHLEFGRGAYFPRGGMISIARELYNLAERRGVEFHFNTPVESIETEAKRVKGVIALGKMHEAGLVVCNSDVVPAYRKLLQKHKAPEKILEQPRSSSALIFYWGMNRIYEELDMHNIFFSNDYRNEFDTIHQGRSISEDPTVYINITSAYQPDDAPAGGMNWFVMINVPGNTGQDWDTLIEKSREAIILKLEKRLKKPVRNHIVCEEILDPVLIEKRTSSFQGSLYGSSSNNRYAAFLRHANFSTGIKGLYFCGGSVHPGGGIPLALKSAKIVAGLIR
ncbi:MAG: 1-hydroxycarotenoid 3,4-desaturase CrtD [Bacteroidia bacterium]